MNTTNYGTCQRCGDPIITNGACAHCAPCLATLGREAITSRHPDTSAVVSSETQYPEWRAWMHVPVGPSGWYVMVTVIGERDFGPNRREYRVHPVDARVVDGMVHWVDGHAIKSRVQSSASIVAGSTIG